MRVGNLIAACFAAALPLSLGAREVLSFEFNEGCGSVIHSTDGSLTCKINPRGEWIEGVEGSALLWDGFSTRIVLASDEVPSLKEAFCVELWLCPASFPKCLCPILLQRNASAGLGLYLDVHGNVHFCVADKEILSRIALNKWSHIVASCSQGEISLDINGEKVSQKLSSPFVQAAQEDLWIGRTPEPSPSYYENKNIPIYASLDGAMDNLRIYDDCPSIIKCAHSPKEPTFALRRLPSGPEGELPFGAWQMRLKYYPQWDEQFRSNTPDIVVGFGKDKPWRMVFWRGISYAPCLVTEKGNWMSNECVEREHVTSWGCCENLSDKHADFSSVRILENSPARAVVHWRNLPVGVNLRIPYQNLENLWGDCSEETYTFYPDGVCVRKVELWSSELERWHEWSQSLQVLHYGQRPEDVLDENKIMSLANMQGETRTFAWDFDYEATQHQESLPLANIQVSYLNSKWNPYLILDDSMGKNDRGGLGPAIERYAGKWSEYSKFPWRNHWPVNQDYVIGRYAVEADAPSHTYTATQFSAAYSTEEGKITKVMLCGCTDKDAIDLLPLAKSWLHAPDLSVLEGPCTILSYNLCERAYKLSASESSKCTFRICASEQQPSIGLCLLIEGWDKELSSVLLNGKRCKFEGSVIPTAQGSYLALWVDVNMTSPYNLTIR